MNDSKNLRSIGLWTWLIILPLLVFSGLVFSGLVFSGRANATQLDLDEPLDLNLAGAPIEAVLKSMAKIIGADLDLDPAIQGKLTIQVEGVPWQQILDTACQMHELSCELIPSEPPLLRARTLSAMPGYHLEPGLVELIDISLKKASLVQTLKSFGAIAGREVVIDPEVSGEVTLNLRRTPWPLAAQWACEINNCTIEWGAQIVVHPLAPGLTNPRFNLELSQAKRSAALNIAVNLPSFIPSGLLEVEGADAIEGRVDVDLSGVTSVDVLQALCSHPHCRWELVYGPTSILKLQRPKPQAQTSMSVHPPRSQAPVSFTVTRQTPGLTDLARDVRFTWSSPQDSMTFSAREDLVLSWLPFSNEDQFVLPIVNPCREQTGARLLEAVPVPLQDDLEIHLDDTTLRFQVSPDVSGKSSERPRAQCASKALGRLTVTLDTTAIDGTSTRRGASPSGDDKPDHSMIAMPGTYLLIDDPTGSVSHSAVLVVGRAASSSDTQHGLEVVLLTVHGGQLDHQPLRLSANGPQMEVQMKGEAAPLLRLAYRL